MVRRELHQATSRLANEWILGTFFRYLKVVTECHIVSTTLVMVVLKTLIFHLEYYSDWWHTQVKVIYQSFLSLVSF